MSDLSLKKYGLHFFFIHIIPFSAYSRNFIIKLTMFGWCQSVHDIAKGNCASPKPLFGARVNVGDIEDLGDFFKYFLFLLFVDEVGFFDRENGLFLFLR